MKNIYKNRKGSITIMAIFVFLLLISSATMLLFFANIQSSLSKNQLEKIQLKYNTESYLLNLIYSEENFTEYISDNIFTHYRKDFKPEDGIYNINFKKENMTEIIKHINKASIEIRNIEARERITFYLSSKYDNTHPTIKAYGTLVGEIFELKKSFLNEEELDEHERKLFLEFMKKMQEENWDYDRNLDPILKSMVVTTDEDIYINLVSENNNPLLSPKRIIKNYGKSSEQIEDFTNHPLIIHLKKDLEASKSIVIGEVDDKRVIKTNGVLYIEGDLIINQDFEFLGLIIINGGNIIANSKNRPIIKGMILNKGNSLDISNIDLRHNQKMIYKYGSYLPGFLDVDIKVIKKY